MMSFSAWDVVRMTIGMCLSWSSCLISSSTSRPSFLGRFKSRRMRSGFGTAACFPCRRRKASASTPSSTTCRLFRTFASRNASFVSRASPGLSSTSRISMGTGAISSLVDCGEREVKRRALLRCGLHPDPAAVTLDNLLADGEPQPRARVLVLPMQALEDDEDPLEVLRVDADPVVANAEQPLPLVPHACDSDVWRCGPAELECVRDEVQEQMLELAGVGGDRRQSVTGDGRARLIDRELEVRERAVEHRVHISRREPRAAGANPRERQQILDQALHPERAVERVADELVRVGVELPLVTLAEQLHEAADHAQRLLQVVRRDIREALQLLVGAA